MTDEQALLRYFRDIQAAVQSANQGKVSQPYRSGTFMVTALAGEIELTISDITEEDAILIVSELQEMGVKAIMRASIICRQCGVRVPLQEYCTNCRAKLPQSEVK